jgi:hypothetical protein
MPGSCGDETPSFYHPSKPHAPNCTLTLHLQKAIPILRVLAGGDVDGRSFFPLAVLQKLFFMVEFEKFSWSIDNPVRFSLLSEH